MKKRAKTAKNAFTVSGAQIKKMRKNPVWLDARKAVSKLWSSSNETVNFRGYPLHRASFVFGGKRGLGKKKAMVVEAKSIYDKHYWLYWPSPSEALRFGLARQSLESAGFGDTFIGSVGVIEGKINKCPGGNELEILHVQGNFSQGKSPELSRSLVDKHGGWRQHLLNRVFQKCVEQDIGIVSFKPRSEIQKLLFLDAARKNGFEEYSCAWFQKHFVYVRRKAG